MSSRSCTIFCSGISPSVVLFLLAAFTLYMGILLTYNWSVLYCMRIAIPYGIVMILYLLGGLTLLFGVMCSAQALIKAFPWFMYLCLIGNIVYDVLICIDQQCVCNEVHDFDNGSSFEAFIVYEYFSIGFLGGLNYVATLFMVLIVLDYLKDSSPEN